MTTRRTSKTLRASGPPPAVNTVNVSEFVRGALYNLKEPTVVMTHGTELGTWYPRGQGVTANYYSATSRPDLADDNASFSALVAGAPTRSFSADTSPPVDVVGLNKAVQMMQQYLAAVQPQTQEESSGEEEGS